MTSQEAKEFIRQQGLVMAQWAKAQGFVQLQTDAPHAFDAINEARTALQSAYCQRMATVMAGVLAGGPPEVHREWIADAALCLAQFVSASDWVERQTGTALPQSTPASAA